MENETDSAATTVTEEIVARLMEAADGHFELFEMDEAIDLYNKALRILQLKRELEEQTSWVLAALGDCHYILGDLREALRLYVRAFNLPSGYSNAYVLLRTGQVYFGMDNLVQARYYLLQAYLIEGDGIFENEDERYFALIKDEELLRPEDQQQDIIEPPQQDAPAGIKRGMKLSLHRAKEKKPGERKTVPKGEDQ